MAPWTYTEVEKTKTGRVFASIVVLQPSVGGLVGGSERMSTWNCISVVGLSCRMMDTNGNIG